MIVNANSIVQNIIKMKYGIIKHFNVNVKIIVHAKKIIVGILVHVFENSRYLQSIFDELVILCDDIINVTDGVSANVKNYMPTNVTSIA